MYDWPIKPYDNIKAALGDYREQRFGNVKAQYADSHRNAKLRYGHVRISSYPLGFKFKSG
ncbi:hypothetical protein BGX30_000117 [Mortierella sp. GBA39]|nr:hypothetical protein BGX30_000117 [Mortierella sp. GBA39]